MYRTEVLSVFLPYIPSQLGAQDIYNWYITHLSCAPFTLSEVSLFETGIASIWSVLTGEPIGAVIKQRNEKKNIKHLTTVL